MTRKTHGSQKNCEIDSGHIRSLQSSGNRLDNNLGIATQLLIKLSEGDESSIDPLFAQYRGLLEGIARKKLHQSPVRDKDEFDATQSVIWLFVRAVREGKLQNVNNSKSFEYVLLTMLKNKLNDYFKHEYRQKRGGGNVTNLSSLSTDSMLDVVDYRQTDKFVKTSIEDLLTKLSSDRAREIAELIMHGYTRREISDQLDITERTVYRELENARLELQPQG